MFFSKLDSLQEIQQFALFFKNIKNSLLYKETLRIRNLYLFDSNIKKPLLNGFEFGGKIDVTFSSFLSRSGKRDEKDSNVDLQFSLFKT